MENIKKIDITKLALRYGAVVFFLLLLLYNCFLTPNFVRLNTVQNLFVQSFPVILISFGLTLVIATANIDISVGSGMALSAMIFALTIDGGLHPFLAFLLALIVGGILGWFCGVLVARFDIQSMIVTMAMMYMLRGMARGLCGGSTINFQNAFLSELSYYRIGDIVPIHLVIVLILFGILYFVVEKTRYGTYIEAVGNNPKAARISGINVNKILISVYVISAVLAVLAGIEQSIMVMQADSSNIGLTKEFDAIAATVVGGTPMSGGRVNLVGTFFAALLLQLINMMVNMNHIYYALAYIIKAVLIIGGVLINTYMGKK